MIFIVNQCVLARIFNNITLKKSTRYDKHMVEKEIDYLHKGPLPLYKEWHTGAIIDYADIVRVKYDPRTHCELTDAKASSMY